MLRVRLTTLFIYQHNDKINTIISYIYKALNTLGRYLKNKTFYSRFRSKN